MVFVKTAYYFQPKIKMLKYSQEVSVVIFVDIECINYSKIFECRLSSFLINCARESRFL